MTSKTIGKMKSKTDPKTGRTKLTRVHAYDASKTRKIRKSNVEKPARPGKAALLTKRAARGR